MLPIHMTREKVSEALPLHLLPPLLPQDLQDNRALDRNNKSGNTRIISEGRHHEGLLPSLAMRHLCMRVEWEIVLEDCLSQHPTSSKYLLTASTTLILVDRDLQV